MNKNQSNRNFVREDRLRQGPRIQSPGLQTIDNGNYIIFIKIIPLLLIFC